MVCLSKSCLLLVVINFLVFIVPTKAIYPSQRYRLFENSTCQMQVWDCPPNLDTNCTHELNPVKCGCAGCKYSNQCQANGAGFSTDECTSECSGNCRLPAIKEGKHCTDKYQPVVCGCANCEYNNTCFAITAGHAAEDCREVPNEINGLADSGEEVFGAEPCESECPKVLQDNTVCIADYSPKICGCNDCEYSNSCWAAAAGFLPAACRDKPHCPESSDLSFMAKSDDFCSRLKFGCDLGQEPFFMKGCGCGCKPKQCSGDAGINCPDDFICVDDPTDNCLPSIDDNCMGWCKPMSVVLGLKPTDYPTPCPPPEETIAPTNKPIPNDIEKVDPIPIESTVPPTLDSTLLTTEVASTLNPTADATLSEGTVNPTLDSSIPNSIEAVDPIPTESTVPPTLDSTLLATEVASTLNPTADATLSEGTVNPTLDSSIPNDIETVDPIPIESTVPPTLDSTLLATEVASTLNPTADATLSEGTVNPTFDSSIPNDIETVDPIPTESTVPPTLDPTLLATEVASTLNPTADATLSEGTVNPTFDSSIPNDIETVDPIPTESTVPPTLDPTLLATEDTSTLEPILPVEVTTPPTLPRPTNAPTIAPIVPSSGNDGGEDNGRESDNLAPIGSECWLDSECKSNACYFGYQLPDTPGRCLCNPSLNVGETNTDCPSGSKCYSSSDRITVALLADVPNACMKPFGSDCENNWECVTERCGANGKCQCNTISHWPCDRGSKCKATKSDNGVNYECARI